MRSRRMVQLVSLPSWTGLAEELRRRFRMPIVYDCHDFVRGFRGIRPSVVNLERRLFEVSDMIVFSSRKLMEITLEELPERSGKPLALIRNGVDSRHFAAELEREDSAVVATRPPNVAGYLGALDYWFDVHAVDEAARANRDWRFVLIGRTECEEISRLRRNSNVEFAGEVPYAELPRWVRRFKVGLIPFRRVPLTLAADPIKLYEYFSLGLPVVSTRLPEVERFGDLVYLADTPAQFAAQVKAAGSEEDPSKRQGRISASQTESWNTRAAQLVAAIEELNT